MKEFEIAVFWTVFQEMLGPMLWILLLLAIVGVTGFLWVVVREGKLSGARLIRAEIVGVLGGFFSLALTAFVTVSGFTDAGGPVDWLLVGLIWGIGLAGFTILAYAVMGLMDMNRAAR